eukprot:2795662-Heterocapsa_arctica.AAC.1
MCKTPEQRGAASMGAVGCGWRNIQAARASCGRRAAGVNMIWHGRGGARTGHADDKQGCVRASTAPQ